MRCILIFCVFAFCAYTADAQLQFLNCPTKIASALLGECQKRLQERLDLVNTAEQEIDASAPSMFRCCYFQEFIHCVTEEAKMDCGVDVVSAVERQVSDRFRQFSRKCTDYSYYSASCIFVVWFNLIVIGAIVFGILLVGCCLGMCLCR